MTATLFRNATLVELDPPSVRGGDLRQKDGLIVAVGEGIEPQRGDEVVDCDGRVLMPGLVNGHTHLYSALAAGMPAPPRPPRNFLEILELVWWRLDRAHTLESVRASGRIGALAALRCGVTTLVDHHASPNAIDGSLSVLEAGIAEVGCRGVLCYEVTDRNRPTEAAEGLAENERYIAACQADGSGQFAGLVGGHASFTLKEESLAGCVDLARRLGVGVHIHVAEDPVDEETTRRELGCGLVERFERHGLLDVHGTLLAHGTHLSAEAIAVLGEHRAALTLGHNPNSNMNNGVGYTPVVRMSVPVTLGTDGIGADMWREMRTAQFKSHDAGLPLPFGRPLNLLAESARFASRSLGVRLGELAEGAAADLVLTDYRPATPLAGDNLAGHVVYAMGPEFVRDVMVAGQWRLRNRQATACDEAAVQAEAAEVTRALWERMANE